ncbi:xylulose kinase [Kaistia algarum]|uniref:xylulokinase n=1 Tax=Kaistia algarum TaxID=2083279 RepID=UPI000CE8F104|nr:FGGY family carbohydrate kinase [Kaistia algarum]MCX5514747.1 FGGY family carbohydrate kinase [Kaistia algarum]PPE78832.1 xylulose kinase [Kaistia algarum]
MQDGVLRDLVVGIDSSTSATKAIAWDRDGRAIAEGRAAIPLSNPKVGHFEQDPADWWGSTVTALSQLIRQIDAARIAGISISNQRETFGLFTEAGEAVRPGLVWLDDRATPQQHSFGALFGAERIRSVSGKPLDVIPSLYRMIWLKEHEPEAFARADRYADVHAYLTFKLTGQWLTSAASADPSGMVDMREGIWSEAILTAAGLPMHLMPEIRRPGTQLGEIDEKAAAATGLLAGTPLIAGGGDGQCAGTGAGVLGAGRGYINLGTALVAGTYGRAYAHDLGFRTEIAIAEEGYIFETCQRSGTFLVDWLTQEMMGVPASDRSAFLASIEAEATASPLGAGGVMLLPFWQGSMTPHWDSAARGVIAGLSGSTRRGDLYRALLEGLSLDLALSLKKAMAVTGQPIDRLQAIGGGARSELFLQILADTLDRPISRSEAKEASSLGAAIAAAKGIGWFATIDDAAAAMVGRAAETFDPDPGRVAAYQALAAIYDELWPILRNWNQRRSDVVASLSGEPIG